MSMQLAGPKVGRSAPSLGLPVLGVSGALRAISLVVRRLRSRRGDPLTRGHADDLARTRVGAAPFADAMSLAGAEVHEKTKRLARHASFITSHACASPTTLILTI